MISRIIKKKNNLIGKNDFGEHICTLQKSENKQHRTKTQRTFK